MAASSKKVIFAALIGNALIAVTKFVAAAISGSSAMFSEGIHSCVDTGNQLLMLLGLRRAKKPPDTRFPFGHGKEIYFWCFVVSVSIFAIGATVSLYKGFHQIQDPHPIENPVLTYVVLALALVFEGMAWLFALTEFTKTKGKWGYLEAVQKSKDPSVFVVLFEDSAAMLGLAAAFLGILLSQMTGSLWLDGAASLIIGVILAGTAVWLAWETKGLLIGESASEATVDGIRKLALTIDGIDEVYEILTMHMGPEFILVNISVRCADRISSEEMVDAIAALDRQIKTNFPLTKRVFIEAERR